MRNRFSHQAAVDYVEAWNKLNRLIGIGKTPIEQMVIVRDMRNEVEQARQKRGQDSCHTGIELAVLAASDEFFAALQAGPNYDRNAYVVEFGQDEGYDADGYDVYGLDQQGRDRDGNRRQYV